MCGKAVHLDMAGAPHGDARALQAKVTAAQQSGAASAADLQGQYEALEAKATTLFQGETLRGLLLTSYGFSIFGDRAQTAAWVCYAVALVLFVAGILGLVHAFSPAGEEQVFVGSKEPTPEPSA